MLGLECLLLYGSYLALSLGLPILEPISIQQTGRDRLDSPQHDICTATSLELKNMRHLTNDSPTVEHLFDNEEINVF